MTHQPHSVRESGHDQSVAARPVQPSTTSSGVLAMVMSVGALTISPLLLLIPFVGFAPALIAGAGAFIAARSLRHSSERSAVAVSGLVIATLIFALLAGVATFWNLVVAGPAVGDYQELHDVIEHIKHLIFG